MGVIQNEYITSGQEEVQASSLPRPEVAPSSQKVSMAKSQPRNFQIVNSGDMYRTQDIQNIQQRMDREDLMVNENENQAIVLKTPAM